MKKVFFIFLFLLLCCYLLSSPCYCYSFVTKFGGYGEGNGQLNSPQGIAIDRDGNIYVADMRNSRIVKFSSAGEFLLSWGSNGSAAGQFQ